MNPFQGRLLDVTLELDRFFCQGREGREMISSSLENEMLVRKYHLISTTCAGLFAVLLLLPEGPRHELCAFFIQRQHFLSVRPRISRIGCE